MLRRFPSFQVATTCLSYSHPDLNFLVTFFSHHICVHVKSPLPPGGNPIAVDDDDDDDDNNNHNNNNNNNNNNNTHLLGSILL